MKFPIPKNEKDRIAALEELKILDTLGEIAYDDITNLAALLCDVPVSLISLVDHDRQWFKSKHGIEVDETPREVAFCAHAIMTDETFYIPNSDEDERFAGNPLVTGEPHVKFYTGIPLKSRKGHKVGTLCVIDQKPRTLSEDQLDGLQRLARQVESLFELRLQLLENKTKQLEIQSNLQDVQSRLKNNSIVEKTQEVARIGTWIVDVKDNLLHWSKMTYEIHELDPNTPLKVEEGINFYVEEHREIIQASVEQGIKNKKPWDERLQIKTAKGSVRWVRAIGYPVIIDDELVRLEGTFQDIDESVKKEEQLRIAKKNAETSLKAKSIFLANMSHELRTPLNGIMGITELLLAEETNKDVIESLTNIKSCGFSLLRNITDILDLSTMEAGKFNINTSYTEIAAVVNPVVESFKSTLRQKQVDLNIEIDSHVPGFVLLDVERYRQVLFNLVGNALKFTEHGSVTVSITYEVSFDDSGILRLMVSDTGIGIGENILPKLFTPFEQGDSSITRKYGGSGLGLSICKNIVAAMKGEITVESREGEGTIF